MIVSLTPFDIHRLIARETINIPFKARKLHGSHFHITQKRSKNLPNKSSRVFTRHRLQTVTNEEY